MDNRFRIMETLFNETKSWKEIISEYDTSFYVCPTGKSLTRVKNFLPSELRNELILFASNWEKRIIAITSNGIYNDCYFLEWDNIDHFEAQQSSFKPILKPGCKRPALGICYSSMAVATGFITLSVDPRAVMEVESILNKLLKSETPDSVNIRQKCNDLIKQGDYKEAFDLAKGSLENFPSQKSSFYQILAEISFRQEKLNECINYCKQGQQSPDYKETSHSFVNLLYKANKNLGNYILARVLCNKEVKLQERESSDSLNNIKNDFESLEDQFKQNFFSIPYQERKALLIVNSYHDLSLSHIQLLRTNSSEIIDWPVGHPVANKLYIGHPLVPSRYIPFENYQLELVEDKVREFCILAQNLGATEISIECLNSSSSDQNRNTMQNLEGGAKSIIIEGNASYQRDYSRHIIDELSRSVSLRQTFEPYNKPVVPEGMVWYNNEPSWQRLAAQRLSGGLSSHEERIETRKIQMIDGRELSELKAEIDSLYLDLNMSMDKSEESKFEQQENAVLSIKVKFAPLSQLAGSSNDNTISSVSYSSSEQEYLDEVKECLADGEIGPRERRLLDKIREKLGITPERASELEATLAAPQLTDDEKEYLTEFKECAVDGVVSDKERRLLEKMRNMLGISEERARELERM